MPSALQLHPDYACPPVDAIEAEVLRRSETHLALRYTLQGDIAGLRLPGTSGSERRDSLWERTCFEALLRPAGQMSYIEFNFAPSTQWASYAFSGYRQGMAPADVAPPKILVASTETQLTLDASFDWEPLADGQTWRLGLAAVIEELDGNKSYWALAHPPGKPDFHHSDCFALELPIAESP